MPRPSSIRKLPPELRAELDRLLTDGRWTLTDITAHLRELGADVSRSSVHRYSQDFERVAKDLRLTREMAQACGRELEDVDGDAGRLVIESLQSLLLRARLQLVEGEELDVGELSQLARAAKDLQTAFKSNVDAELKIRARFAKEAADVVEQIAKSKGLSADAVDEIRARILGIARSS